MKFVQERNEFAVMVELRKAAQEKKEICDSMKDILIKKFLPISYRNEIYARKDSLEGYQKKNKYLGANSIVIVWIGSYIFTTKTESQSMSDKITKECYKIVD